ncbi:MAG: FAD-dependent oxidoreductase [Balneolaceae bacterium]
MTIAKTDRTDVVIIGGGPIGLYLAIRLLQQGISCTVLEKRSEIDPHSKSLGIHPVSLALFKEAGIEQPFLEDGLPIRNGHAFWDRRTLGTISFAHCPPPFPFILALPQWRTEELLQEALLRLDPDALIREADVTDITQTDEEVTADYIRRGYQHRLHASFAVGCDGKESVTRRQAGIAFPGHPYPDTYMMGDFDDHTAFGSDAAVYLHEDGLVESFPLPNGQRRWVAKTDHYVREPNVYQLAQLVQKRLGNAPDATTNRMLSSFGVQHHLADTCHRGRMLLAGDAAHIVSPIGGQGMNLGWLDAHAAASTIRAALDKPGQYHALFRRYSAGQRGMAKQTARRAEWNMHLGRRESHNALYKAVVLVMLTPPVSQITARVFTMYGLGRWWI